MIGVLGKVLQKEVVRHQLSIHPPVVLLEARLLEAPAHKHIQSVIEQLEIHEVHRLEALPEESVAVTEFNDMPALPALDLVVVELEVLGDADHILTFILNELLFTRHEVCSRFTLVCSHFHSVVH